ncbi:uncharacterized protein LOC129600652 [Paramacrobiotus metropolitanus]|uniref:uncharacterized protein LOC129600652 n=1 Tax=Paramacrobiotus metropolitanus TaxID=2943436 RepID=UPI0024460C9C|nr:uncharacterized protein LOC129600652 [Paramacrobiotus metropolitanus]
MRRARDLSAERIAVRFGAVDGTVVFDPSSQRCSVGPGIIYSGTVTAIDMYTGIPYHTAQITMDTENLGHCVSSTPFSPGTPCNVTYPDHNGPFAPMFCDETFFTPNYVAVECAALYELTGLPCAQAHPDGSISVNVNGDGCVVGSGITYNGTLTVGAPWIFTTGTWDVQMDTTNLQHCPITTSTTADEI